jgi:glycosyltransferase involved in cell wall biosynthesis
MIRLLEILPTLRRAGAEAVALWLAAGLPARGFEAGVVSMYDPSPDGLDSEFAEHGMRVWRLGKRRGFDPRMWPRLARVLREFQPDVLHTHSYVLRYVLPVSGRARVVHTLHNLAGKDPDRLTAVLNRVAFRRGVVPVAVSGAVARSFETSHGFAPAATIPNGIDLRRFDRPGARGRWRAANGFAEEDVLIASVARLEPQKDPVTLIRAFAQAPGYLLLAGDGSLREAAAACARDCGVGERVRFLGVRADVPELLCASDIFVLASRYEGNPVSVMEAMAAGLPAVAPRVGGIPELVDDGVSGLLVEAANSDALGRALASLVRDPQRRRKMGEAARSRAQGFRVETMVEAYATLFRQIAGRDT